MRIVLSYMWQPIATMSIWPNSISSPITISSKPNQRNIPKIQKICGLKPGIMRGSLAYTMLFLGVTSKWYNSSSKMVPISIRSIIKDLLYYISPHRETLHS